MLCVCVGDVMDVVFSVCIVKGRALFSGVLAITGRRDIGVYEVPLFVSLLGFRIATMLANFHV